MKTRLPRSQSSEDAGEDWRWFDPASAVERATDLVPLWVAESVVQEAAAWLRAELPETWAAALAAKAERSFAGHRQFHRLICAHGAQGNAGRDQLYKFMRHWLASRLARERPALYRRLPAAYALGRALPGWAEVAATGKARAQKSSRPAPVTA